VYSKVGRKGNDLAIFILIGVEKALSVNLQFGGSVTESLEHKLASSVEKTEKGNEEGEKRGSIVLMVRQIL